MPLSIASTRLEGVTCDTFILTSSLQFGITPFMYACSSTVDRSKKVRYLDQKGADQGADCQANDHV